MSPLLTIRIQSEPFDAAAEIEALSRLGADVGAVASFIGFCRSEGGKLSALELEHYPGMAEEQIGSVVAEAASRWPLFGVTVIHRHGVMRPGDGIVLVVTASSHRTASFEAANFVMDYLKTRAPFWKKEHLVDGSSGDWVDAKIEDDRLAARWKLDV
jgi:molybdopterin synthase catalytic subunit